jgi:hypothetical protein
VIPRPKLALSLLAFSLAGLPVLADPDPVFDEAGIRLMSIKPSSVTLTPAGRAKIIRVQGSGFEGIKKIQFIRADKMIHSVTASYRTVSRGIGELKLEASAEAEPGADYRMVFVTSSTSIHPPIQVSVAKESP